ncbi:MAG TPA: MBL fold metallo-hydrolase [Burkholderiales bacterium]|nr:MBL fold metallo-hydrolase [Burkholderiales bacterium]
MRIHRMLAAWGGLSTLALSLLLHGAPAAAQGTEAPLIKVTLLGTGGPELTPLRFGYATLVEAGGQKLLFDAGRGVLQRLYESKVNVTEVTKVFFTHLHNDHIDGFASLWMTPWFLLGRDQPFEAWGPPGTAQMVTGMRAMYAFDIEHRSNKFNDPRNLEVKVSEIGEGVIYEREGVKVTTFSVWHDDGNPAFGYRIDYRGRAVVLSGDTTYSENLVKHAQGVDLIVHNVIAMSERLTQAPEMKPVLGKLTTPEQAARTFLEARPRMAVYSHIVKKELHGQYGDNVIIARTRAAGYRGPLEMGHDRMTIEIGAGVRVLQPVVTDNLEDVDRKAAYAPE